MKIRMWSWVLSRWLIQAAWRITWSGRKWTRHYIILGVKPAFYRVRTPIFLECVCSRHREDKMPLSVHSAAQTSKLPYIISTLCIDDWVAESDQFSLLRTLITENPGLVNSLDAVCYYHRIYMLAPTSSSLGWTYSITLGSINRLNWYSAVPFRPEGWSRQDWQQWMDGPSHCRLVITKSIWYHEGSRLCSQRWTPIDCWRIDWCWGRRK